MQHVWTKKKNSGTLADLQRAVFIDNGIKKVDQAFEQIGLKLNQVCASESKQGGSTDGNTGRRLFSIEAVHVIKEVTTDLDATVVMDVLKVHKNASGILRVMSC